MNTLEKEMIKIPDFIVTTDVLHHSVWNRMMDCNYILYNIATGDILSPGAINVLIKKFDTIIDDIAFVMNGEDFLMISKYYSNLEDFFIKVMFEKEMYEGLENFKNFNTKYLQFIKGE